MRNNVKTKTDLSKKDYWQTSDLAYDDACHLCGVEAFDIDVAASIGNRKCSYYLDEDADALSVRWFSRDEAYAWCNPPFSLKIEFLQKAYEQRKSGTICMMIPFEPATKWWRDNVDGKAAVVFVPDGRYSFVNPETGLVMSGVNFPSCFVVFNSLEVPTQYVNFERGVSQSN